MPEIDYGTLKQKISALPEANREAAVIDLKKAGYTWTMPGASPAPPEPAKDSSEAVLTNKPTQGFMQGLERASPALAGALTAIPEGAAAGAAAGAPFGPYGALAGGAIGGIGAAYVGGVGGEAARQAAAQGVAVANPGKNYPVLNTSQLLKALHASGKEQAVNELGGRMIGPALDTLNNPMMTQGGGAAKAVTGWLAKNLGGVGEDTMAMLKERAPDVMSYARKGYTVANKAATDAAKTVQGHIENLANKAGEAYRQQLDEIVAKNPQYNNLRIDLERNIGDAVQGIRNHFGFTQDQRLPNLNIVDAQGNKVQAAQGAIKRLGKSADDVSTFNEFADGVKNARTPTQVYYLQRDLSDAIKKAGDSPLGAALSQLKTHVVNAYDASVQGTPMASLNTGYRQAMTMVEELSKVANSDNPLQTIKSAFSRNTNTGDSLEKFFQQEPAAAKAWAEAKVAAAGAQLSKWSRHFNPNTGASLLPAAAVAEGASKLGASPLHAIGAGAIEYGATSPRLYGEVFNALGKPINKTLGKWGSNTAIQALQSDRGDNGQ